MRRTSKYDSLAPRSEPTWLVVRNVHSQYVAVSRLPPRQNLRATIETAEAIRRWEDWTVEPRSEVCSGFFCSRDGARERVGIERFDPELDPFWKAK